MEAGAGHGESGAPQQQGGGGAAPAAGWYPDPEVTGRHRWWDGARWTEHVHPPGGEQSGGGAQPHGGGQPYGAGQPYGGGQAPGGGQPYGGGPAAYPGTPDPNWLAAKAESDARQWAMFAHLSALLALVTSLNWLGPLIIYLVKKNDHPFVAEQAREALNFNISVFIYMAVTVVSIVVLAIVLVGFLLIPVAIAIGIAWLVFVIIAAVRANAGQPYRYPLTIRMVT